MVNYPSQLCFGTFAIQLSIFLLMAFLLTILLGFVGKYTKADILRMSF